MKINFFQNHFWNKIFKKDKIGETILHGTEFPLGVCSGRRVVGLTSAACMYGTD
jgi:hypothetical protein